MSGGNVANFHSLRDVIFISHNTDQVFQPAIAYKMYSHMNMLTALWHGWENIIYYPHFMNEKAED